ncbi:hypothetical protein RND81_01G032900 [Saponaria officinalis]|uniref:Uncharacterized protein n=1 Tax=Saponaria officinalis TaxID=3572 RepID=A0AAW1N8I6_SAPOF
MSYASTELLWLEALLRGLQIRVLLPISLHCDNKTAQSIAQNLVFLERTKHLNVDCHFVRDKLMEGFGVPKHVPSQF